MELFNPIYHSLFSIERFMHDGGSVLWGLALVVVVCWLLIMERIAYFSLYFPKQRAQLIERWQSREEHFSWFARAIRDGWLAESSIGLRANLTTIKLLVSICPMIGLLGTVTGMISVFDVMAIEGSSNPQLMASGISMATLPTLAGMVAALAGMFVHARLVKRSRTLESSLERSLRSQQ